MDWLAHKYIGILSHRLDRFVRKGPALYNFRCPFCGDSPTDPRKARGYIYESKDKLRFFCQKCNKSLSIHGFIKALDQNLFDEYQLEQLQERSTPEHADFVAKMKPPVFIKTGVLRGLKKVSQLSIHDPIKQFVMKRQIPTPYHAKLFSCPNFMHFVNDIIPDKFSKEALAHDETRLLIPFLSKEKNVHAFQGRSLSNTKTKYITIITDESQPKVYGLDTVNKDRMIPVVEGPIDAMFIPNAIAAAGGDLVSAMKLFDKSKLVIVYDNEPRKHETVNKIDKAIVQGYNVCIWPSNFEHKDINDMVLAGLSPEFIEYIIKQNTYGDLAAKIALQQWSKV